MKNPIKNPVISAQTLGALEQVNFGPLNDADMLELEQRITALCHKIEAELKRREIGA